MRQHIININVFISPALCPECSAGPRTGAGYGIVGNEILGGIVARLRCTPFSE
jgi:hypothetical protein